MIDLSIAVDIDTPLTRDEAREYCLNQGTGIYYTSKGREVEESTIDWLLNHLRPHQAREAVRRNLDLLDFDEWQAIENVLLANDPNCDTSEFIPLALAARINSALWEELDTSPLELEKSYETEGMYKLELSFSTMNKGKEYIDMPNGFSLATVADTVEDLNRDIEKIIWRALSYYRELDNTEVIVNKLISKDGEYVDSDEFTIRTNIVRTGSERFADVIRDLSSFEIVE